MKNVLFAVCTNGWYSPQTVKTIKEKFSVEKCYVIASYKSEEAGYQEQCLTFFRDDCIKAKYEEYEKKYLTQHFALDDKILKNLYPYLLEIMLENLRFVGYANFQSSDKFMDFYELLLRHMRFWYDFILNNSIDTIIFSGTTHECYDYVIYTLAEALGVNIVLSSEAYFPSNRTMLLRKFDEIDDVYLQAKQIVDQRLERGESITLLEDSQAHFDRMISNDNKTMKQEFSVRNSMDGKMRSKHGEWTVQSYLKERLFWRYQEERKKHRTTIAKVLSRKVYIDEWKRRKEWYDTVQFNSKLYKESVKLSEEYESLCVTTDYSDKFIFYAAHFTPEASSLPNGGGLYWDQFIPVDILAEAIPDDWYVYVKIHPAQLAQACTIETYKKMAKNPKVKLISREVDSYELTKHSQAVSTLIGHILWEAQFFGKPAIVFGITLGKFAPMSYPVRTVEDCKQAVKSIMAKEKIATADDLKYFLMVLDQATFISDDETLREKLIEYMRKENL